MDHATPPLLQIDGVTLVYGKTAFSKDHVAKAGEAQPALRPALQNISLELAVGEFVCLLGPSGCGKSSLLRVIAGLEMPQFGRVSLRGKSVSLAGAPKEHYVPPERRGVGLLSQDFLLFPHLRVRDNIGFGLESWDASARVARLQEMLQLCEIAHLADAWPHHLSGGEQQRVALARALAPKPMLLLLDEPFSSLDRQLRDKLRQDTKNMLQKLGQTVLMVTHDSEEALAMADRILVMQQGEIIQQGRPQHVYQAPASRFIAELFGAVTRVPTQWRDGKIQTVFGMKNPPAWAQMGDKILLGVRADLLSVSTTPRRSGDPQSSASLPPSLPQARLIAVKPMGAICELTLESLPSTGFALTLSARIAVNSEIYDDLIGNPTRDVIGQLLWLDLAEHNCLWFRRDSERLTE